MSDIMLQTIRNIADSANEETMSERRDPYITGNEPKEPCTLIPCCDEGIIEVWPGYSDEVVGSLLAHQPGRYSVAVDVTSAMVLDLIAALEKLLL